MKVVIIDGQGGRVGQMITEQLKKRLPQQEIIAIGTNSIATLAMLKAGADHAATGENPVIRNCRDADLIIGPIGIVLADALMGEVTPAMAAAVGSCNATKLLIPINRCNTFVAGMPERPAGEYIRLAAEQAEQLILQQG